MPPRDTTAMKAANIAGNPWTRNMAMMHVAMSDAVNSVQNRYALYAPGGAPMPTASAEAAAAAAARAVLLQQLPRLGMEFLAVCALAGLVLVMLAGGHSVESLLPVLGREVLARHAGQWGRSEHVPAVAGWSRTRRRSAGGPGGSGWRARRVGMVPEEGMAPGRPPGPSHRGRRRPQRHQAWRPRRADHRGRRAVRAGPARHSARTRLQMRGRVPGVRRAVAGPPL